MGTERWGHGLEPPKREPRGGLTQSGNKAQRKTHTAPLAVDRGPGSAISTPSGSPLSQKQEVSEAPSTVCGTPAGPDTQCANRHLSATA